MGGGLSVVSLLVFLLFSASAAATLALSLLLMLTDDSNPFV